MVKFAKCLDKKYWTDQGTSNTIKFYSRRDTGTVGMLMEVDVEVPVEIFLTIMAEAEFYDQLIPTIK